MPDIHSLDTVSKTWNAVEEGPQNSFTKTDMKNRLRTRFALAVITALLVPLFPLPLHAEGSIVIGEVAWAGSSLSAADEWIELWNLGEEDVSLAGYTLTGASTEPIAFPDDAMIVAGGTYLISNYSAEHANSALAALPDLVTTSVSLSNSALELTLRDVLMTTVDHIGDGSAPAAGNSGAAKASMIRTNDGWMTATVAQNMKEGVPDFGTPDICDGCAAPTSDEETESVEGTETLPPEDEPDALGGCHDNHETVTSTEEIVENTEENPEITDPNTEEDPVVTSPEAEETEDAVSAPPRYELIRLNEILPDPESGPEWIELVSLDPSVLIPLEGMTLHDNLSKVYTFATGTLGLASPMVVAELSSMKLNNGGDSVILKTPDGHELEIFTYGGSEKASSWARIPDGTGTWKLTPTATPGHPNLFIEAATPAIEEDDVEPAPLETDATDTPATDVPIDTERSQAVLETSATKNSTKSEKTATKTNTTSAKKPTTKKAATPANTKTIHELSIDMTHDDEYGGMLVRLHGTVGSMPGIVSGHAFVLLSPTGRGIRVSVPTSVKLPDIHAGVAVTGKLTYASNDLPYLKMSKDDAWVAEENATPMSREVSMLAPAQEDAWSLVTVEGTVGDVKSNKIMLDVDGTEAIIFIKGMVDFRAQRLVKGDTVQVTGLLEMTTDGVRVLPRSAEEIVTLTHAEPAERPVAKPSIPGWTPFGAAGLAVVGSEGLKQIRSRNKKKMLERVLETEENL